MEDALRAGAAVYNAGEHHAAHDAWEDHWLDLESGTDDERFLHGLIQFTAAIYHARRRNWSGATGLAESATEYLGDLDPAYRSVNVGDVRTYLQKLAADPELIERRRPLELRHRGDVVTPGDLSFDAAAIAAEVLAEEYDRYDETVIGAAIEYANDERDDDTGRTTFVGLVLDFAAESERRDLVYNRLRQHVERRQARDDDVKGLFDDGE